MKSIVIILIICFLLSFCSKRDNSNEEKQETLIKESVVQKIQEPEVIKVSYVFDIDSFRFLDEFPKTIEGIKAMYPDEDFEEKTSPSAIKGLLGENWYTLESKNIIFSYLGDTIDEAVLYMVEFFTSKYQCDTMQIIGMPVKDLENISGKELNRDKEINISTDLYVLSIITDGNTVKTYTILRQL